MKEMLFIDGQLVDLGEATNITLSFKSNIFTDLSKIVGNSSYTINLPKTVRNLSIIGNADAPASESDFPRVSHPCRYFRNGVEIIADGRAVLLSVSDNIEVVLTWGSITGFASLVEDGKNLNEVAEVNDYVTYMNVAPPFYHGSNLNVIGVGYVDMNVGLKSDETLAALHPVARCEYILNLLQNTYGVKFEFPEDKLPFIQSLVFPLLTRNGGYANMAMNEVKLYQEEDVSGWMVESQQADSSELFEFIYYDGKIIYINVKKGGKYVFKPNFKTLGLDISYPYASISYYDSLDGSGDIQVQYFPYRLEKHEGLPLSYMVYDEPIEIELTEGGTFYLTTGGVIGIQGGNASMSVAAKPTEVNIGDKFPIVENLPDIKSVDFLKAISSMVGLFAIPSDEGVIRFVSVDDLADVSRAFDWSDKLLPHSLENKPKNVSYVLDDFARNNRFSYKEDDTNRQPQLSGNITVDDETLDFERDAVTLPFAATDTIGGKAQIALYEYNDDGEPELQSVEPRVLIEKNVNEYAVGSFIGLSWGELLGNYYRTYQRLVSKPIIITENMMLNDIELRELDVTRPIYLRQYGRYYAIVEIKAPSNGVCECKFLQLDL